MPILRGRSPAVTRDAAALVDTAQMSISEKVKAEGGRHRKSTIANSSSSQNTTNSVHLSTISSRASLASGSSKPKVDKEITKRNGTVGRKPGPKPGSRANFRQSKQDDISAASTLAANRLSKTSGPSDSESNDGGEYCICRGPDDHRMMVNCEGPCKDWYHCSCLDIDVEDAKELLDRYICPKCSNDVLFTTYKPMCRNFNFSGCRKAARIEMKPTPSMYCSEQHRRDFWLYVTERLRSNPSTTIGGALSKAEVASLARYFQDRHEWLSLGTKPKLTSTDPTDYPAGLSYITTEENERIELIRAQKSSLEAKIDLVHAQKKLLVMIHERCKTAALIPNLEVKDICGYDNRLAMNQSQFLQWKNTAEGNLAFETGVLGPRTEETSSIGMPLNFPGETVAESSSMAAELQNICLKPRKKCKHNGWRDIHGGDYQLSIQNYESHKVKLQDEVDEIVEEAELREATKDYHAHNITIRHF
ncbi:BgTH12-03279 [Blumeria graminis f. sp. triticale]|uniref:BgTH12-03279 n=2 Tax=Blumeria graminis TaxID=34373 RepID=A0A9W4GFI3_BLUGR|nr:hypothetical protein BGT96224_A20926 [Blumeria graminis f. sp. tritici 96224]CAD6503619.1 BgTH12-03279 [Blumeria graminis f. sp. triticale]